MKLQEFINILETNPDKELLFAYTANHLAGANYHLTEVKNVQFDTTDCGGKTNFWKETHFQIWESPKEIGKTDYMKTDKILSIIKRVGSIKPLMLETELKIEYGNQIFPTSVMPIDQIIINEQRVVVNLFTESTRCKANDVCGVSEENEEENSCCTTVDCC